MKIKIIIFLLFAVSIVLKGENGKILEFENKRIVSYENVKYGEVVNHTFVLKNVSDSTVVIKKFSPSCNCTSYSCSKMVLEKGETTEVKVVVDTKGKIGENTIVLRMYTEPEKEYLMKIDMNIFR